MKKIGRAKGLFGLLGLSLFVNALASGCGDKAGDFETAGLPTLEVTDDGIHLPSGGTISVSAGALATGESGVVSELRLANSGTANLEIRNIEIISEPPGAFVLSDAPEGQTIPELPLELTPEDTSSGNRSLYLYLIHTRAEPGIIPSGKLRIHSNSVSHFGVSQPVIEFDINIENSRPILQAFPATIDLGTVPSGEHEQSTLNLLNQGGDTLIISSFVLRGHPKFEVLIGTTTYAVTDTSASSGIVLAEPLRIEALANAQIGVRYSATDPSEARGELILFSNDPARASGLTIPIQANVGGPCITVNPRRVDFGGKLVGREARVDVEITSCGDATLEVSEISLSDDSSREFSLSLAQVEGAPAEGPLTRANAPVKIAPGKKVVFQTLYFPEDLSAISDSGNPVQDIGEIHIRSNAFDADITTEVSGFGVDRECPTAVIIVQEGEEVIPQTTLHLIGAQSYAASGTIERYQWEVDQPNGSRSVFRPSANVANPTFEVNAAGVYKFRLSVEDSAGEPSCVEAETEVYVNPDEAIHVELLWDTPNDTDPTDSGPVAGADLDLHFTHPLANGGFDGDADGKPDGWFDTPFDAYWGNKAPDWGSFSAAVDDNPSLDRDDTDGAGPENLNLDMPENGARYKVGVQYWKDHGFGPSLATVRVYIFGVLVFETRDIELLVRDMWTVTEIEWPPAPGKSPELAKVCAGTTQACVTNADCGTSQCGLRITPDYVHPWIPYDLE